MRALILSGGGAKGAFTVGALLRLRERGIGHFDLISGTSTGSLIAALVCNGDLDKLRVIYNTVQDGDILARQNILENMDMDKPYLFDTLPLQRMIDEHVTEDVYRNIKDSDTHLCLTAVDLQTGMPTVFSTKRILNPVGFQVVIIRSHRQLKNALLASSNQAAFLPPISMTIGEEVHQFVDGGNREVLPTKVVCHLLPTGPAGVQHEVYLISNNPEQLAPGKSKYTKLQDVLMRAISIFIQDVRENDLNAIQEHCRKYGIKLITIEPKRDLDEEYPTGLRFSQQLMANWMVEGKQRTTAKLDASALLA